MLDSRILIALGPPLAGKSSFARALVTNVAGLERFSVRSHFEPMRRVAGPSIPPVGTLLSDDAVLSAAQSYLRRAFRGGGLILDGLPGTAGQAVGLVGALERAGARATLLWFAVDRAEAWRRACNRRVCPNCDGGVDDACIDPADSGKCAGCGGLLGGRPDDNEDGFATRWKGFFQRLPDLLRPMDSPCVEYAGQDLTATMGWPRRVASGFHFKRGVRAS